MKISVITPVRNQRAYIKACLDSVKSQTYKEYEHIVIDGKSTDGTWEIINSNLSNLSYCRSELDDGPAFALNKGFRQAKGDILCWLNGDDMLPPWSFSVVYEIFNQHPRINWITGIPSIWKDNYLEYTIQNQRLNKYSFLNSDFKWIQQESTFFRRSLFDRAGSYISENFNYMYDLELWSRFFLIDNIFHVQAIIGGFRPHQSNNSRLYNRQCQLEAHQIINKLRESYNKTFSDVVSCTVDGIKRKTIFSRINADKLLDKVVPKTRLPFPYTNVLVKDISSNSWVITKTLCN
jgi:glycosyltransferase involved in cell wall biosynthesis